MAKLEYRELGTIGRWSSGGTPDTGNTSYFGGAIPWVVIEDLNDGMVTRTARTLTEMGIQNSSASLVPANTLLIAMYGSIGKLGITGMTCATNQAIASCQPNLDEVDLHFLFYYLLASREELATAGNGVTQSNISQGYLKEFVIPLPPLDEQRRIAAILRAADGERRRRRYTQSLSDGLLGEVFVQMFGDPATNPMEWRTCKVEQVLPQGRRAVQTGPFGSALKRHEYVNLGVPVWGIDNLTSDGFQIDGCLYVTTDKYRELAAYDVEDGDVLVSRAGTVGRMCVAHPLAGPSIIGTNLVRVRLDTSQVLPDYFVAMFFELGRQRGHLRASSDEGAYSFMNPETLRSTTIILPHARKQQEFIDIKSQLDRVRRQQQESARQSDHLFATLLQRAFSGELSGAETRAESA